MYHLTEYWFTKEGIEEYLQEKQKEYSFTFKALTPYNLWITHNNSDPRSDIYVKNKIKVAEQYNIKTAIIKDVLSDQYDEAGMIQSPCDNFQSNVNLLGCRDIEGLGKYWRNLQTFDPTKALWPCTARGIYDHAVWVANKEKKSLEGKTALIIGRSDLVGRPIAQMFERLQNMTVIQCHSHTPYEEITSLLWHADIVVCAVGKPNFLKESNFGFNQYIYDVGINPIDKKITGDILHDEKEDSTINKYITPVPGGVGRLTVHALMHNTIDWYLNKKYYQTYYGKS